MNVLSLFDGMSCAQIALNNLGIKYDIYFASEIDCKAICVTQSNYPKTIQLGSVEKINGYNLPKIHLLCAGSPCQGFSKLGKGRAFEDDRSKLFFEFLRIKDEVRPDYFFLENVLMDKESRNIISEHLGVEPILLNSSTVSAQSRRRLYWTNLKFTSKKRPVLLSDILQKDFDNKYLLGESRLNWLTGNSGRKSIKKGYTSLDANIAQCLTRRGDASWNCNYITSERGIRRLTPIECERLQGVKDDYTAFVSDSARYEMLGNGWNIPTIEQFFCNIGKGEVIRGRNIPLFIK